MLAPDTEKYTALSEHINTLELENDGVPMNLSDKNIDEFIGKFKYAIKKAKNRKATMPNEVPSEAWRMVMMPMWVQPGFKPFRGIGHSGEYTNIDGFTGQIRKMFSTMLHKQTLPVQSVIKKMWGCQKKSSLK